MIESKSPAGPVHLTVASLIFANGAEHGSRPAIMAPGRPPLTWADLAAAVSRHRAAMRSGGVHSTHRVAISLPDGPEKAVAFLSVASAAAALPLRPTARTDDATQVLRDLKAQHLIAESGSGDAYEHASAALGIPVIRLRRLPGGPSGDFTLLPSDSRSPAPPADPGPDGPALVVQTSGTTGRPKVAPLSNRVLLLCAYADRDAMSLTSDDCGLIVMPMHHVSALRAELLAYLVAGGSAMCAESPVSDDSIIAGLRDPRVTTLTASPFYYQAVVNRLASTGERLECPSLRFLRSSSSGLSAGLHARLEAAIGVPVIEDYGATEAGLVAMNPLPPGTRKPGSVGRPVSVELRVMSDYWEPLPPGQTGELVVRGGTVFAGYDSPADTSAKFKDGWLRMGDRGYLDNDGYLWLAGRTDDIINRGGEKIDPSEVEAVLLAYDGVADAVAFGLPDAAYGHEVYAAVVVRPGARVNASELRAAARQTLHRRAPRMITIVGSLPKTSTGKVKRREAAAMYADSVRTPE